MPIPFPKHAKKILATNELTIYTWPQKLFDGSIKTFDGCARPDTVAVIPFLNPDTILLTREEQPGIKIFWDVPGGKVARKEKHLSAVKREMLEETGFVAKTIECWSREAWHGIIRFEESVFVAKNLKEQPDQKNQEPGERLHTIPTPWKKAVQMCLDRKLRRSNVMLAILRMEFDPKSRARLKKFLSK